MFNDVNFEMMENGDIFATNNDGLLLGTWFNKPQSYGTYRIGNGATPTKADTNSSSVRTLTTWIRIMTSYNSN